MDNPQLKIWKWSTVILLVLNLGVIAFIFFQPRPTMIQSENSFGKHHPPHGHHPRPDKFIIEELKLDKNQVEKFHIIRNEHRKSMDSILKAGKILREKLFDNLAKSSENDSSYIDIIHQISINQSAIETVTYEHFFKLKKICNKDQLVRFNQIIGELAKRLAGPPPPPIPPPPPGAPLAPPPPDAPEPPAE